MISAEIIHSMHSIAFLRISTKGFFLLNIHSKLLKLPKSIHLTYMVFVAVILLSVESSLTLEER